MKYMLSAFLLIVFASCTKESEPTKFEQYKNIAYRIDARDSDLTVKMTYAIYENNQKKSIVIDTVFINPGIYSITAKALTGEPATLFGISYRSGNYGLQISSGSSVLVSVDSLPYFAPTALDTAKRWFTTITAHP